LKPVRYLVAFACFECRKSFKRPHDAYHIVRVCPHCGGAAVDLGRKFKPPQIGDSVAWNVVKFLYESGFPYFSIENAYPSTMSAAREFVELNAPRKLTAIQLPVRRKHPVKEKRSEVVFVKAAWFPYKNPTLE
jgi:hypothetical protein